MKADRSETADGELSRRDFVRGAAATGLVVVGGGYMKPALKLAGVTRLSAATSNPPPPPGGGGSTTTARGCTPAFWRGVTTGGATWWDQASDPLWIVNGGHGTNPFTQTTLFNSFFTPNTQFAGLTMLQILAGAGSTPARRAARATIAGYLNASFGGYAFTTTQLRAMWSAAAAGGNEALRLLARRLEATNSDCGGGGEQDQDGQPGGDD